MSAQTKKTKLGSRRLIIWAAALVGVLLTTTSASASVTRNVSYSGNSSVIDEIPFEAENNLTSVTINVNYNNQGSLTFASDLIIGIVDPSGNAIEIGPAAGDSGSLDGYMGLTFTKAGNFPASWRTENNGTYAHGPINVGSFGLSGAGTWRLVVKNSFSQTALWNINASLGGINAIPLNDIPQNVTFTGREGDVEDIAFLANGNLSSVSIGVVYNNLGNFAFASDLIIGIVDPSGNAIEIGPAAGDPGSLDGYTALTFANAGNFPSNWRNDSNGNYAHGPVNVATFGLSGAGVWRLVITSGFSNDASWDINLTLSGIVTPDSDGDGVYDVTDNCPSVSNPSQTDADGDGFGDACDLCPGFDDAIDTDGDTVADDCDNCPDVANSNQADADSDGFGDACDVCPGGDDTVDTDGDGVCDTLDACPGFDDSEDVDTDGIPDACDMCPDANVTNVTQGTVHPTIQAAIDASAPGDVIELGECTFIERGIILNNKDITLRGQGPDLTIIDGDHVVGTILKSRSGDQSTVENLTLRNGIASQSLGGGAAYISDASDVAFRNCRFESNEPGAQTFGAVYIFQGSASFQECTFRNNVVASGGDATAVGTLFGNASFVNCLFEGEQGGGSVLYFQSFTLGTVVNCTFADFTGGQFIRTNTSGTHVDIINSVFDASATPIETIGSSTAATWRSLFSGATGDNIDGVPTFVDAVNGDYRLANGSLGIDAADYDEYVAAGGGVTDLNGEQRTYDDPATADSGAGAITYLDMGAYEAQAMDSDGDGVVDSTDNCPDTANSDQLDSDGPDPALSPVAAWHFDEAAGTTATDVVAAHDGTLNNAVWNATGYRGAAMEFPVGGSSVSVPASTDFDITDHLTIALWVNPSAFPVNVNRFLTKTGPNYVFRLVGQKPHFYVQQGGALTGAQANIQINANEWTHLAATWDGLGDGVLRIYVNGVEATDYDFQGTVFAPLDASGGGIGIGNLAGERFEGLMDELAIFDRAFSPEEITNTFYLGIGDGFGDACDNCPDATNLDQADADTDGFGDACDVCSNGDDGVDADTDGVPDACDVCAGFKDNVDTDSDGIADGCDLCPGFDDSIDTDADGLPDGCDTCPGVPNVWNVTQDIYYPTIQAAIDASSAGDVIELAACTFNEYGITLQDRILTIRGQGPDATVIDAQGAGWILDIDGTFDSTIADLTLQNGFSDAAATAADITFSSVDFRNCRFEGDSTVAAHTAGAISGFHADVRFEACEFLGEQAPNGSQQPDVNLNTSTAVFLNCLFAGHSNPAAKLGVIDTSNFAPVQIVSCTFADFDGGAFIAAGAPVTAVEIHNSVFDASATTLMTFNGPSVTFSRCLFSGATGDNIDGVPTFVDAASGDYRLAAGTLGIDAADYNTYTAAGGTSTDLNGDVRTVDACVTDTGIGALSYLDMGAYESQDDGPDSDGDGTPDLCDACAGGAGSGDTDGDGDVDLDDYANMNACIAGPGGGFGSGCECFDFDVDGDLDMRDVAELQLNFTGSM